MDFQFVIAVAALVVAIVACVANIKSTRLTLRSVRPFVCLSGPIATDAPDGRLLLLRFKIVNHGSLPAEHVDSQTAFFAAEETVTSEGASKVYHANVSKNEGVSSYLFPGGEYTHVIALDRNDKDDKATWDDVRQSRAKIRIIITYDAAGRRFRTVETLKPLPTPGGGLDFETETPTFYE